MKNKSPKAPASEAFGTTVGVYHAQCVPPRSKRKRQRLRLRRRETPPPVSDTSSSSSTSIVHHHHNLRQNRLKPRNHSGRHHAACLLDEYIPPAALTNDRGSGLDSHQPKPFLPFLKSAAAAPAPAEVSELQNRKPHQNSETDHHRTFVTHKSLARLTKAKLLGNAASAPKPTPAASRHQLINFAEAQNRPAIINCEQILTTKTPPTRSASNITTNLQSFYKTQLKCPSDSMIPLQHHQQQFEDHWTTTTTTGSSRYLTDLKWRICYATNIYVFKNGDGDQTPILIHIPPAKKKSMQCILSLVEERISFPIGYAQCLYNMNGVVIRHPGELEMYNKYVVASNCDKAFKPVLYGKKRTPMLVLGVASKHVRELRGRYEASVGLGKQGDEYQENASQNCSEVNSSHVLNSTAFQERGDGDTGFLNHGQGYCNAETSFEAVNGQSNPGCFRRSFVPIKMGAEAQQEPCRYRSLHNQGQGDAFFATPPNTKASNKQIRNGIKSTSGDLKIFYEDVATTNVLTGFDEPGGPYSEAGTQFCGPAAGDSSKIPAKSPLKPITPPPKTSVVKTKTTFTDLTTSSSPQDSARTIEISTSPRAVAQDSKTHLSDSTTTTYLQARPGLQSCATFRVMQPQYANVQAHHNFSPPYHHHHPAQQFFPEGATILTNPAASMQSVIYVTNPCQPQFHHPFLMSSNQNQAAFTYWPSASTPITRDWLPNSHQRLSSAVGCHQTSPADTVKAFEHCVPVMQHGFLSSMSNSKGIPATLFSQCQSAGGKERTTQCKDQSMQTVTSNTSSGPIMDNSSASANKSEVYPLPPPSPFKDNGGKPPNSEQAPSS